METGSLSRRAFTFALSLSAANRRVRPLILISANAEWKAVKELLRPAKVETSPHGEWFIGLQGAVFFHGGWGKIAAAASTEFAIARWNPKLVVNLGTCGGVAGVIDRYAIVLAEKTIVYDIVEMMGDSSEAIRDYSTDIDLSWLPAAAVTRMPAGLIRTTLLSADRDLSPAELRGLREKYGMRAGDWESGAIAWVAVRKHKRRLLILRGVSDLVSETTGGQAYGKPEEFVSGTRTVMKTLLDSLPDWLPGL
jgi:adenosylhomocysteine nucleosidase